MSKFIIVWGKLLVKNRQVLMTNLMISNDLKQKSTEK